MVFTSSWWVKPEQNDRNLTGYISKRILKKRMYFEQNLTDGHFDGSFDHKSGFV